MNEFISTLEVKVRESLKSIHLEETQILRLAKRSTEILESAIEALKYFIKGYQFENEEKEILFFKEIKPVLFSQLIYFQEIYRIELDRPTGGEVIQTAYFERELEHIRYYFSKNKEFYHYYRDGADYLDREYFLRGKTLMRYISESFYIERDPLFSTRCDFKVAKILANDLVEEYLKKELRKLSKPDQETLVFQSSLFWTGNKNELVLLVYGLHKSKRINYGELSLKQSVKQIELMFNVDLGNYSRTYHELQNKKNSTAFLEYLKKLIR